jgi:uncharacterized protein
MYGQSRALGKSEGVNIFYCHGWGSHFDPGKAKIRALARMGPVDGVTVDYTLHPQLVFATFAARLKRHPEALVVGTSLGGFFAAWLGAEFHRPFIAINPAIAPSTTLQAHVGRGVNHIGDPYELKEDCVMAYDALTFRLDGRGTVVLDMVMKFWTRRQRLILSRDGCPMSPLRVDPTASTIWQNLSKADQTCSIPTECRRSVSGRYVTPASNM